MRERIPFDAKQKSGTAPDGSIPIDIYGITGGGGGGADWGQIGGTLADQTDLKTALDGKATSAQGAKADSAVQPAALTGLATETFVDNQIQGIEFPVSSVNGEQGLVILDAAKVGAVDIVSTPNRLLGTDGSGAQSSRAVADFATSAQGAKADSAVQPAAITGLVPNTRTVAGKPLTGNVTLAPTDVGAATAAQGALASTAVQPAGLTKAAVGLGSVDNTSDAAKPVSTAQQTALDAKVSIIATVTGALTAPFLKRTLRSALDTTDSNVVEWFVGSALKSWLNEWGAMRGTSPYTWGDALVRGIRDNGDGITSGRFLELVDRRTSAPTSPGNVLFGVNWTDGRMVQGGNPVGANYVLNAGQTEADIPANLPAGTVILRKSV